MMFSIFSSLFKKTKEDWLKRRESEYAREFSDHLQSLQLKNQDVLNSLEEDFKSKSEQLSKKLNGEILLKENEINKKSIELDCFLEEVEKKKRQIIEQIRIVEAKANPDTIWTSAFSMGFSKAWDIMIPLMEDGYKKKEKYFYTEAVNSAIKNLEPAVQSRVNAIGDKKIVAISDLISKKKYFENQLPSLKGVEKDRASHFIEALNWVTNGNGIQKN